MKQIPFGNDPFLRLWEDRVFRLLLNENRIDPATVRQFRSWRHSGFGVDRSVRLAAGDRGGIERLAQYMARSPFSLARIVGIGPGDQVLYRAGKQRPQKYPDQASPQLFPGAARNFQVSAPLDFLADILQHIPDKGEHPIRYYGYYSNKARGVRARKEGDPSQDRQAPASPGKPDAPTPAATPQASPQASHRRHWAMLIRKVYNVDPLLCPQCGGTMKVIAFIEAHQTDVLRKILEHCGLWRDPPARDPPARAPPKMGTDSDAAAVLAAEVSVPDFRAPAGADSSLTYELDPDFIEHQWRQRQEEQARLPFED